MPCFIKKRKDGSYHCVVNDKIIPEKELLPKSFVFR